MSYLKLDPKNYRIHTDKNKRIIRKSIEECGAGRSILVDKDNVIIAGNGVYEQAQEIGLNIRLVESDGTDLIVVKRTDLSNDDEKRKHLAFADNHTSDTSVFDFDLVVDDFEKDILDLWEFNVSIDNAENEFQFEPENLTSGRKDAPPTIKISFPDMKTLESFEKELKDIMHKYKGLSYTVGCGEM